VLLGLTALLRFVSASLVANNVLKDDQFWKLSPLIPVRDFLALAVWAASFTGKKISWRGTQFELRKGKLVPPDSA